MLIELGFEIDDWFDFGGGGSSQVQEKLEF